MILGRQQVARCGWAWLMLAGLALLAAGCGSSGSAPAKGSPPESTAATSSAPPARPTLSVYPNAGLVGGQQLQVSLTGYPQRATVAVYECAGTPPAGSSLGCGAGASSYLYTGNTGSASEAFTAQPAVSTGPNGARSLCQQQCVLVGGVIKLDGRAPPRPAPMASAPLSFSVTATPGLADASLADLSWVSGSDGWALAAQPCTTGTCARIARTSDGGADWQALPDPPAHLQDGTVDCSTLACVSGVRFASPTVGYLYGPALLMTSNGGRSWQVLPGPQVETLSIADGNVYRVAYDHGGCPGPCQPTLQEAAIGSTAWHTLIGQLASPDRNDTAQIVASDSNLLVALYGSQAGPVSAQAVVYRSTDSGVSWERRTDPCSGQGATGKGEEDLTDLAASPGGFFAGLCSPHTGSGTFVVTSADAGGSWQRAGELPNVPALALLSAASPTTLCVATGGMGGGGAFTAQLLVSTDAGRHWTTAATDTQQLTPASTPAWLGFETAQVGRWIGDPHAVWTTNDGGLHWTQAAFR
ncbi:MAG: neocarzinostatin apoprotein domain-containing protein [Mycobacteriales bacterium]